MAKKSQKEVPRLYERYQKEIVPHMMKRFGYKNIMEVPKVTKVVINSGVGEATQDAKFLEAAVNDVTLISGQKAVVTKAKKSISNFKLRENVAIGCRTTLRSVKMYEFMDRLLNVAIPRVRDFRGVNDNSFDGKGNYTLGIREQIIFPEINYDKVVKIRGFNVTFVTTAETDEEGFELLLAFGMPFRKREKTAV
ncbi:50S ribosomal protein L5 [bacterium I07]|nr:50S ribosomal protein L5 [bacterium I07]